MNWETVIGLEVHAQLTTKSKLFSGSATQYGGEPNTQTSYIDAALPGTLPVVNERAVYLAVQLGIAINAEINRHSTFERKNYFYPDLPKGYQISQFQRPIVSHGYILIDTHNGQQKKVAIDRAHLEEDAGKSLHDAHQDYTGIDLNRAGTPLLEIVTAPCLSNAQEAIAYLKSLHQLLRFLHVCDGNMQEGSFRCDVNLSLRPQGSKILGTRSEIKNLNSFKHIEKAILYEQWRHQNLLESGESVVQQTRLFDPVNERTEVLREKENENDYRYFPDPDLLPIFVSEMMIAEAKETLPATPAAIAQKLSELPDLNQEDVSFILSDPAIYSYFVEVSIHTQASAKLIINWLKGPYVSNLNTQGLDFTSLPIAAHDLGQLLDKLADKTLHHNLAKKVFDKLWAGEKDVTGLIAKETPTNAINTTELEQYIIELLAKSQDQVSQYKAGKEKVFGFFVGQVMKETKGKVNPELINELLKKHLSV